MIDTIKVFIPNNSECALRRLHSRLMQRRVLSFEDPTVAPTTFGKFKNFSIKVQRNEITIVGSLSKFYLGNNIETMTQPQIKDALNQFQDETGIHIAKGLLSRVDVGRSFLMDEKVEKYLVLLKDDPRFPNFERWENQTRRYTRHNFTALFYDKIQQMMDDDEPINENYMGRKILRYEIQFLRRIKQQLRMNHLMGVHLMSRNFLQTLETKWRQTFNQIPKYGEMVKFSMPYSNKLLRQYYIINGIELTHGRQQLNSMIDDQFTGGLLTINQRRTINEYFNISHASAYIQMGNKQLNELTDYIQEPFFKS